MVVPNEEPKKPRKPKNPAKPKKSRERSLPVPVPASSAGLSVVNPDAAGIDVHSNMHMVCVPADRETISVRQFGANTADLQEIAAWLKKCRVKTVALESTGVYWIPLFELLESEGFEVYLVEPGQLSRCGARPKTDVLDAQWIQRLHSYGLLRASFRPPDLVLALRAYWRQRQMQVRYAAGHVQHMQIGLVLPPDPQSDWWAWSSEGDRAQAGVFGLQDAQARRRVRDPVDGRIRGQDEGQRFEGAGTKSGSDGIPTESAAQ